MRDIAAASGMLAGSLYYHFASKEELLVAVYAEGVRRISVSVRAALARDPRSLDPARSRVCRAPRRAPRGQRLRAGGHPCAPDDAPDVADRLMRIA
jgi:AcrR family transcriptional regulator